MSATDFMPLDGWDHVELWVGNAKQAAYFYEHAFGFTRTAYAGPETGVRDRASYVLEQGDVRSSSRARCARSTRSRVTRAATATASGTSRSPFPDATRGVPPGRPARRPRRRRAAPVEDEFGRVELATIATYGDTVHTFVNRADYAGPYLPGYVSLSSNGQAAGVGLRAIDHCVGNVELGRMDHWVEFYERVFGMTEMHPLRRRGHLDRVLGADVEGDGGRRGKIKFPINEPAEGKRKSQIEEYLEFYGGPGVQHIALASSDIVGTVEALAERGVGFLDTPDAYYEDVGDRVGEIDEELGRPAAAEDPRRPRRRRLPAADLHEDRAGPADALLRGDRAPRRAAFGDGNFKALFEAIEREQALRGNL